MQRAWGVIIFASLMGLGLIQCKGSGLKPCQVEIIRTEVNPLSENDVFVIVYVAVTNPNPKVFRLTSITTDLIVSRKKVGSSHISEPLQLSPNIPTRLTISFFISYTGLHEDPAFTLRHHNGNLPCQLEGEVTVNDAGGSVTFPFRSNEFGSP